MKDVSPVDPGILKSSVCLSFTPNEATKELFFYPTLCGHYFCTDHYYIKRDNYPSPLVLFVRRGIMRVQYAGEEYSVRAGDVVLLDCSQPHAYCAENGLEFLYLHFDGSNAHDICRYIIQTYGWLIQRENNMLVGNLLYDMIKFYQEGSIESAMRSSMRIYRLFDLLLMPSEQESAAESPIEQAIQFIRSHIGETISLEDLAASVCLSVSYFSHLFKKQTGFAPLDYIINTRMENAKVLLICTNHPIAEIAIQVGYASAGSLINQFKKRIGMSPRQYRQMHQSKRN